MTISPIAWPPPDAHSPSPSYNPSASSPGASPPHGAPYFPPVSLRNLYRRHLRPLLFTEFQTITIKTLPRSSILHITSLSTESRGWGLHPIGLFDCHRKAGNVFSYPWKGGPNLRSVQALHSLGGYGTFSIWSNTPSLKLYQVQGYSTQVDVTRRLLDQV